MANEDQRDEWRREHRTPEPDENTTYKEATTVTEDENPPLPAPPQESGTMLPHT